MYSSYWYWYDEMLSLRSWISEIWNKVDQCRMSRSWQVAGTSSITAMIEDGDRPEEKPRPPAGGHTSYQIQTRINSDTGGFKVQ